MTCKLNADTSDGLKIVSDTSGEIDLQIDASTKVHMASDGKVGIGTTSPAQMLHVKASDARIRTEESSGSTTFEMTNTSGGHFLDSSGTNDLTINKSGSANMAFKTANTERMRINGSGQLLVGTTSLYGSSNALLHINVDKVATSGGAAMSQCSGTGDVFHYHFRNGNGGVGGIKTTGSSSAFVTSSDYRLKENVTYTFDATSRLKQLKPCRFNFIADADTTLDGFIAHEVSSIVPEAIDGTKDATKDVGTIKDSDGNVIQENVLESLKEDEQTWEKTSTENVYQGIDQSKLVPLLVKTIQELEARITALES